MEFRPHPQTDPTSGTMAEVLPGFDPALRQCPVCLQPYHVHISEHIRSIPYEITIQCWSCNLRVKVYTRPESDETLHQGLRQLWELTDIQFNRRQAVGSPLRSVLAAQRMAVYDDDARIILVSPTGDRQGWLLIGRFWGERRDRRIPVGSCAEAELVLPFEWQVPTNTGWQRQIRPQFFLVNLNHYRIPAHDPIP